MLSPGTRAVVTTIQGGRGLNRRLAEMGILMGTELVLIRAGGGPVMIDVHGTRLVIGHGMAHRVMVRPLS